MEDLEILLPYQRAWGRDTAQVKVWEKSRRIGASYAEAAFSVLEAATNKSKGGQSTFYLSYNKEMTRQFIEDCAFWARSFQKAAGELEEVILKDEDKAITVFRISFETGFQVWGLPSEPRSLRSKQGRVIIDEAAFVDDLSELLKAAIALTMWGGSVSIMSTHNGVENPFNELVGDIRAAKLGYSLHRTTIQDALDQGLYKRICLITGQDWEQDKEEEWLKSLLDRYGEGAAEELYCLPRRSGERYLSRSLAESCADGAIPVIQYHCKDDFTFAPEGEREEATRRWVADYLAPILEAAPGHPAYIGMDFARSGDLSVMALSENKGRDLNSLVYIEMRNVPFSQQFQIFKALWEGHGRIHGASLDARGNGQHLAELAAQEYGPLMVNQVMISRKFYMEYMPKYKARLENREIIIPGTPEIIDDHRTVKLSGGIPLIGEHLKSKSGIRHGDGVIAAVMMVHAFENDKGGHQDYGYEAVELENPWRKEREDGFP